jgi:hypothetical protein
MAFFGWRNPSQFKTARSSTESEIAAVDTGHREGKVWRRVLHEMGFTQGATPILIDNSATITILKGDHPSRFDGVKHIERRFFACQQERKAGEFELLKIEGEKNPADIGCAYKTVAAFTQLRDAVLQQVVIVCKENDEPTTQSIDAQKKEMDAIGKPKKARKAPKKGRTIHPMGKPFPVPQAKGAKLEIAWDVVQCYEISNQVY